MATQEVVRIPYTPHKPQEAFHVDRYDARYRAAFTGTGGGKTIAGVFECISWMLENPGCTGAAYEPDYPMVRRNLLPKLELLLGAPLEANPIVESYYKGDHLLRLVDGSGLWLGSLEDPERAEGQDLDFLYVDEARLVRKWEVAWVTLRRRLRGTRSGNRTGAWVTTSAPHKALWEFFEGPRRDPGARVYRWSTMQNPHLGADYLRDVERAHSGVEYDRFVLGTYARPEGLVYTEYDPHSHVRPVDWKPERVAYGVDWGWTAPACFIALARLGESIHARREVYASHLTIDEMISEARDLEKACGRGDWYAGPDRPDHIERFKREGFRITGYKGKVADGIGIVQAKFKAGELTIHPDCRNLVRELEEYAYKPGQDVEEPEKGNDHAVDALRYGVAGALNQQLPATRPLYR